MIMNWLQKISAKDQSIVFFFIKDKMISIEESYHEDLLERMFSVPNSISYIIKFAFPRGRIARFKDSDNTYVEISRELNDPGHRYQISELLTPMDRPLWGIETHYFVWSQEELAEKIKEMISQELASLEEINNCSFLREYLPKLIKTVNSKSVFAQKIKLAEKNSLSRHLYF